MVKQGIFLGSDLEDRFAEKALPPQDQGHSLYLRLTQDSRAFPTFHLLPHQVNKPQEVTSNCKLSSEKGQEYGERPSQECRCTAKTKAEGGRETFKKFSASPTKHKVTQEKFEAVQQKQL